MPHDPKKISIEVQSDPRKKSITLKNLELGDEISLLYSSGQKLIQSKAMAEEYIIYMGGHESGMYKVKVTTKDGKTKFLQMVLKKP